MIRCFVDLDALIGAAAGEFCRLAGVSVALRGRFTVALAGGTTPRRLYEVLAGEPWRRRVDWSRVEFFWGDERAVPPHHPASNFRLAHEALLRRVDAPPERIHRIAAERADRDAAAADYEDEIASHFGVPAGGVPPSLDLVLLGLGADGHTASLFPGSEALDEGRRWVVAVADRGGRVTMTLPLLNAASSVIFLVSGAEKAMALAAALEGPPGRLPAQRVRPPSGQALWLVDRAAAAALPGAAGPGRCGLESAGRPG